jgi:hypothetical protein
MHPWEDGAKEKTFLGEKVSLGRGCRLGKMFLKKKVGPRRKWGQGEDVGWGEDTPRQEGGIREEMNPWGWIVAGEEVGLRMVLQGGERATEKVGLGGGEMILWS